MWDGAVVMLCCVLQKGFGEDCTLDEIQEFLDQFGKVNVQHSPSHCHTRIKHTSHSLYLHCHTDPVYSDEENEPT